MIGFGLTGDAYGRPEWAAVVDPFSRPELVLTQRRTIDLKRHAAARCRD
jgi:hypothetical protein